MNNMKDLEQQELLRSITEAKEAMDAFNSEVVRVMEELYKKVFTVLEQQRTEENKKFFDYDDVGEIVSKVYDFYEDSTNEEIIEITQYIWDKYVEHLKTIYDDLEILDDDAVGLKGWNDDLYDDLDDEGICLGDDIEYEEGNQESIENAIDQLIKNIEVLSGQEDNMENIMEKIEWLEKNDNDKLIDLWEDYLDETLDPYNVYYMDDFDEAMEDLTPKEIMTFSNGHFSPSHKYYAYDEDITAYISFNDLTNYEPYTNRKEDFIKFLREENYIL